MKGIVRYTLAVCIAIACVGASILLHTRVATLRTDIAYRLRLLEAAPLADQRSQELKKELQKAQDAMKKISPALVSRDNLVQVVNDVSSVAKASNVTVQIPEVQPDAEQEGVLQDVRVRMNAVGSPSNLVAFIYRLEHLPYLLRIVSWKLDVSSAASPQSFVGAVPPDSSASATTSGGTLLVDVIVSLVQ